MAKPVNLLRSTLYKNETVKNIGAYKKTYVNSVLRTIEGGPALRTRVMIDQGNTLRSGIAISRELHKKLGGKFENFVGQPANTAMKGAK